MTARLGGVVAGHAAAATFVLATLLALALTFTLALHMADYIYGTPGDATGTVALFWWWTYALQHGGSIFNNTLVGAPLGSGWQTVSFFVAPVVVFTPISWLTSPTIAYNLGVLSSFPLTAWATFLLGRELGLSRLAAVFTGVAFAFVPWHVEKAMGHLMQTHLELYALFLFFGLRWRRTGGAWNLVGAGAMAGLTFWSDIYLTYMLVFLALAFLAANLLVPAERWKGSFRRGLAGLALATAVVALVAVLFVPLQLLFAIHPGGGGYSAAVTSQVGAAHQTLASIAEFSARPHDYVLPWHSNPLVPRWVSAYETAHIHSSNFTEQSLFIGYTVMLLGVIGIVLVRNRFLVVLSVLLGAFGFVMSMPPMPRFGPIALIAPSDLLGPVLPIFRAYARFGVLVLLGASLLAGLGFMALQGYVSGRPRLAWLLLVPFLALALEFNNMPPPHTYKLFPAPAEYTWLKAQPPGILVEYPLHAGAAPTQEVQNRQYALYQSVHEHPTFNNGTSTGPTASIEPTLEPYFDPAVVGRLAGLGIRYVFVHVSDYEADGMPTPTFVPGLTYVTTLDGCVIYRVSG